MNSGFSRVDGKRFAVTGALKMLDVGGNLGDGEIVHAFVKASVFGDFYTGGFDVIPKDVVGSIGEETKEEAFAGVGAELGRAAARRADPDATAERAHASEVILFVGGKFKRRFSLIAGRHGVGEPNIVVESIRPEFCIEIGADEHGTNSVSHGEMSTFDGAILVGGIGTSGANVIAMFGKQGLNVRIVVEFATLVEENIFVGAVRSMVFEKMIEPVDGGGFRETGIAVEAASEMIGDENPTGFAVEAFVVKSALVILGTDARERKVD
mmetsp:Transcript_20761/g.57389  ORF Transcript_20761/g.57389 Transcript_20761/m.57389 type:complete len:267 (+) Transcript_20761:1422-2222(+)